MQNKKVVIVGAGISGLSFATKSIQAGHSTILLEHSNRIGGCFDSHRFEDYSIELGAHTCYNSYRGLISIIEKYGLVHSLLKRNKVSFKIYNNGKIEKILKHLSLIEIFFSLPKIFQVKKDQLSVQEFYQTILGSNNYKNILGPSFNAVLSQDAGPFPANSLFKKRERRKDIFRSYTLQGGLQAITDKVAQDKKLTILTECTIEAFTQTDHGFQLRLGNGENVTADFLVFATPVSHSAAYLKDLNPALAQILGKIETASVESVGVIVNKTKVKHAPFAGLIPTDNNFYSVVSRDVVTHPKFRGFTFHFRPGLLDKKQKMTKIFEVLGISQNDIIDSAERVRILPKLNMRHKEILTAIDQALAGKDIYLTGNYFQGLAIEDCINRSFSEFERMISSKCESSR
ncbi:MAG: FAD-dependent oxidoreductase [Bdellovibrio sp.]|nr:FAD-dependent oxidoreductase [Bdellovibrio sp.]